MSSTLIWQCIRTSNSSLRKGLHGELFSAEAGNLYNKHSYKYSGLANANSIDVSVKEDAMQLTVGRVKNAKAPKKAKNVQVIKKSARKAIVSVGKQAASFRPDLKYAATARAAAIAKSLRVKKYSK